MIQIRGASKNQMKIRSFASALAVAGMMFLGSGISWAAPSANPPCPQLGWADGCNTIITLNSNNTSTITITSATTYDGVEDQLVGVNNNSGSTIYSLTLSGSNIFGFDGDGAFTNGTTCLVNLGAPFPCGGATSGDTTGYAGPGTSFTITDSDSGVVHFTGGIPSGGTAYFSLEEAPSTGGFTVTGTSTSPVPEPGSVLFFATGILGIAGLVWKRKTLCAGQA